MKKLYFSIVMFLFLIIPINVLASQEGITSFYIDATVQNNGDLYMKELIILNGKFNGFERIINYRNINALTFDGTLDSFLDSDIYNGDNIELINIKDIEVTETSVFDTIYQSGNEFSKVYSASAGDYGKYIMTIRSNGVTYRIYNPSEGKLKGFYLEYIIKNKGIVHQDIAEVGMNLFDELTEYVNYLEMHIHIPNNKELLRGWAHGPLTGNINLVNNQLITVTAVDVSPNVPIDVRFAFDKNVLSASTKITDEKALEKIIKVETVLADQANAERETVKLELEREAQEAVSHAEQNPTRANYQVAYKHVTYLPDSTLKTSLFEKLEVVLEKIVNKEHTMKIFFTTLSVAWLIGLIILLKRFYYKYDKEYSKTFNSDYYREFPATYGPEILGYLLKRKVDSSDLSASLMNLIYKKMVLYEEQLIGKRMKKTYLLTPNIKDKELTIQEQKLIDFLLEGKPTTLEEIKKRAKKNYEGFISSYQSWKNLTVDAAKDEQFYEEYTSKKVLNVLYCVLGILITFMTGFSSYYCFIGLNMLMLFLSILAIIYIIASTKKTKKGSEHYNKWMGLKKFLKDFSNMDQRELPEVTLWEKYLVYALPLGCAKKLAKDMKIKIQEIDPNTIPEEYIFDVGYASRMLILNNIINESVVSSVTAAYNEKNRQEMSKVASSSSSSGSGFGGGFSSGGGSFGGGGGGGRF